ncbi:baseplate J/gp47 family protein [Nocardia sp. NBC_00508]|uniref:baseplate J/gp47 family protein n=1 Tax=Nocardia sp. NBC_00508 TaxID=2975992 RepID=UPI002E7FF440|nr:baseplate J/gp47 family protein [Nocardia sp. NBC_00508]WUD66786.1 baseplate J/gp47 family protein [Nocardia sp. NBC_00508]
MTAPGAERGRLVPPNLDDRRWADLVSEALALIPEYAPQWTSRAPSDPGITLVELFAYLVEQLIYRLNQVPDKHHLAFLRLLGITRAAAVPARTLLTFTPVEGRSPTIPKGALAQTKGTEAQPPVLFSTEMEVQVLPTAVELAFAAVDPGRTPVDVTASVTGAEHPGARFELVPPNQRAATVLLGLSKAFMQQAGSLDLYVEVEFAIAGNEDPAPGDLARLTWTYSSTANADPHHPNPATDPHDWPELTVDAAPATVGPSRIGVARLRIRADAPWTAQRPNDWVRRPAGAGPDDPARRWIGIVVRNDTQAKQSVWVRHLLLNTVPASTALTAGRGGAEIVGTATGHPQTMQLRNRPVYVDTDGPAPLGHVEVRVDGTPWHLADDGAVGPRSYRLDSSAGELTFGQPEGTSSPQRGAAVTAVYRYVSSGAAGNVAAGAITMLAEGIADVAAVGNLVRGSGGHDEEPIDETKARAPRLLRTRDRAVTAKDYEFLTAQVSPRIAHARCLPARVEKSGRPWTFAGLLRAPGNVHVLVVPFDGPDRDRPAPDVALLQQVVSALDDRRDVTAALHVGGPKYVAVKVFVRARVFPGAIASGHITTVEDVETAIKAHIAAFLHPVRGGSAGRGWEIGQHLYASEVYRAIKPDDNVGYINDLKLTAVSPPPYHQGPDSWDNSKHRPFALAVDSPSLVRVADYELVCFGGHDVEAELDQ